MLKTGICNIEDLKEINNWSAKHKSIAYTLLKTGIPATQQEVEIFEKVILAVQLSSGVFRTTYRKRFADIDHIVEQILQEHFAKDQPLEVHDWAASDALASKEWATLVLADFTSAKFIASDLSFYLIEASEHPAEHLIFEMDGTPLQYVRPPLVIPLTHRESLLYAINFLIRQRCLTRALSIKDIVSNLSWPDIFDNTVQKIGNWQFNKLFLVHPEVINLLYQDIRFKLCHQDVFVPLTTPCHVLRTMNIFNHCYFADDMLCKGIDAVCDSLVEGGIWVTGKTAMDNYKNHISIYCKDRGSLKLIKQIGNGFECADLIYTVQTQAAKSC